MPTHKRCIIFFTINNIVTNKLEFSLCQFQVCGLKWSPDGRYLASGGNDNLLNIWSAVNGEKYSQTQPLYSFK